MQRLRTLHLFAGAGGGILADLLLGHQPVCAVEIDEYCQQVLSARQKDGCLPWFPIFADVTQFDGRPWRGRVDVVSGGFPCQDISAAGRGAGIEGDQSGLWVEMARIVGEIRPPWVFVENSPMLASRGLGAVLGDLAALGYDARWGILGASDVGAPHIRKRIWIVATYPNGAELRKLPGRECGAHESEKPTEPANNGQAEPLANAGSGLRPDGIEKRGSITAASWWAFEPDVGRVAHGVGARLERLKAIGNGQIPAVAALAWETLNKDR